MHSHGVVRSSFKVAWWLRNRHVQTLWSSCFHRQSYLQFQSERLELDDGDFLDLSHTARDHGPLVIVFHGLEGSIRSPYSRGLLRAVDHRGWRGVLMHFRGCGQEPNRLDRNYHSGDTADIAYIIDLMARRHSSTPIAAVGFSLGGNALLKYLAEYPHNPLQCAVAVSVPFQVDTGAEQLDRGFSRFYQYYLLRSLKKKVQRKYHGRSYPVDPVKAVSYNNFWDFDEHVTAPLHGFKDAHDYYQRSSSRQYLKDIRTPSLVLHASDDPFLTPEAIPDTGELSDTIQLELSDRGGHVGFVGGKLPWQPEYWLEKRIPEYIEQFFNA